MKRFLVPAIMVVAVQTVAADPISPWDNGQTEINPAARCPIRYPELFTRERELFAYDPRFLPGQVTFTLENRPVIRIGLDSAADLGRNGQTVTSRAAGDISLIQYLDRDGKWHVTDGHVKAVKTLLSLAPDAPLKVLFGERTCDSVEFDARGNAYTLLATEKGQFLAVSTDCLQSFEAVAVPCGTARLEPYRVHSDRSNPPPILAASGGEYTLVPITLEGTKPKLGKGIVLADTAATAVAQISSMSGDGAPILSAGGKTFFAFMSETPVAGLTGAPQYVLEYDHTTGKVSRPLLLGSTGDRIDDHNLPVIDLDSKGRIHVIAGAHWHSFKHFVSREPFSVTGGFRELDGIGTASPNQWSRNGLSYPGFVIDAEDTLHLVARGRSQSVLATDRADEYDEHFTDDNLDYALIYFRRAADRTWELRSDLVIPAWPRYGNYYHKLTLDRSGGLHVTYHYYASGLWQLPGVLKTYQQRWPEEKVPEGEAADKVMKAHDPVIVSSYDGGTVWAPTTTAQFLEAARRPDPDSRKTPK